MCVRVHWTLINWLHCYKNFKKWKIILTWTRLLFFLPRNICLSLQPGVSKKKLLLLWQHECYWVYGHRMVNEVDFKRFRQTFVVSVKKEFADDEEVCAVFLIQSLANISDYASVVSSCFMSIFAVYLYFFLFISVIFDFKNYSTQFTFVPLTDCWYLLSQNWSSFWYYMIICQFYIRL